MVEKTVIYLTDNSLDETLANRVRDILVREAKDIPIVSVSQKPISLGKNICLGEIGRNWGSLYKQLLAGLEAAKTEYVSIAEHDCLYTYEHFCWMPLTDDTFYYNFNHWLVQWGGNHPELNGMYSYWRNRGALSQLVCSRDLLKKATQEVIGLLEIGLQVKKGLRWHGEFGTASKKFLQAAMAASSGYSVQLQQYLKEYTTKYKSQGFKTKLPNIDIRHNSNFTGPKRGKNRCYSIPYWGNFNEILNGTN